MLFAAPRLMAIPMIDLLMSWLAPILGGLATAWALSTFTSLPKWSILLLTLPGLFAGQAAMFLFLTLLTRLTRNPRPTDWIQITDRVARRRTENDEQVP